MSSNSTAQALKTIACATAGYTLLAVAMTWPLAMRLSSALPHDPYDPALVTWILWWNAHATPFTAAWWSAPFFWPMPGALALSEHLTGISLLTTPLQWLGLSPVASYNAAFIVSFPLAALAAHALVFAVTRRHDAAAVGAVALAFGPYRFGQIAHLQMLWTFGVPLALAALHRYAERRQPRWLALFAVAWAIAALSNGYVLLFFPILIALWVAWYVRDARSLAAIAVAWIAGSLPLVPILVRYEQRLEALSLSRGYDEILGYSADLLAIVSAAPEVRMWRGLSQFGTPESYFFPGALVLVLVAVGTVAALSRTAPPVEPGRALRAVRRVLLAAAVLAFAAALSSIAVGPWTLPPHAALPIVSISSPQKPLTITLALVVVYALTSGRILSGWRCRSTPVFYALAAAMMFLLAAGPTPRIAGRPLLFHTLYWWLLQVPGFSAARVPARFGMLLQLCLVVAASLALARLTAQRDRRTRLVIAAIAVAIVVAEGWPDIPLAVLPPATWIPVAAADSAALLELPFGTVEADTAALFRSMRHRLPIVNGYSGYSPVHYTVLRLALEAGDAGVFDVLARDRDLIVAIDRREQAEWSPIVARHPRASRPWHDAAWITYRIARADAPIDAPGGRPLPIAAATASDRPEAAAKLIDGTADAAWDSGRQQSGNEQVVLDFGHDCDVAALRLDLGMLYAGFPRRLEVDCAGDGGEWRPCWRGSSGALLLAGALADPRHPAMTLPIDAHGVRRIRLRQTARAKDGWVIGEVSAFAK